MTRNEFIQLLTQMPEVRDLKEILPADRVGFCNRVLDLSVTNLVLAHNWNFAMDAAFQSLTVATATYRLEGNNADCMAIYQIAWGTGSNEEDYVPITKKNPGEVNDWLENHSPSECEIWIPQKSENSFPKIKLLSVPATASYSLLYRYWVNGLVFESLPVEFHSALKAECRYQIYPASKQARDSEIRQLINRYQPPTAGSDPAPLPDDVRARNRTRATKFGYSG
jgi:hypothetical protein